MTSSKRRSTETRAKRGAKSPAGRAQLADAIADAANLFGDIGRTSGQSMASEDLKAALQILDILEEATRDKTINASKKWAGFVQSIYSNLAELSMVDGPEKVIDKEMRSRDRNRIAKAQPLGSQKNKANAERRKRAWREAAKAYLSVHPHVPIKAVAKHLVDAKENVVDGTEYAERTLMDSLNGLKSELRKSHFS